MNIFARCDSLNARYTQRFDRLGICLSASFNTIGLVARRATENVEDTVTTLVELFSARGAQIIFDDETAERLGSSEADRAPRAALGEVCDLIVVVGGDGSLLGVAREVAQYETPVVGVNRGGLGFLAAVSPDALQSEFDKIWAGEYTIEDHFLLEATVNRDGQTVGNSNALNDVVVHAGSMARMLEFELWVDDEFVYDQRSDGLIVASPTGSTAYSLSAGGPIMHPSLDAIVIVPMFPHTLTSRPLVVPGDAKLSIRLPQVRDRAEVSCDSQVNVSLLAGDEVRIEKSASPLSLLYPEGHSYYESCRSKLDWASRLGGRTP